MSVLRLRGAPKLADNVIHELNLGEMDAKDVTIRANLRFRVCGAVSPDGTLDCFWRLAPGEVRRLGGPDVEGFVVAKYDGLQTLAFDVPLPFAPISTAVLVTPAPEDDVNQKKDEMPGPLLVPLRFGIPSIFPQGLIGPWLRGGSVIEVDSNFWCRDVEEEFQLQIFPEIIYPRWGGWMLMLSSSNALVLEWTINMNAESVSPTRLIRWMRPWLFKGMIEAVASGSPEVDGVYTPDFTGTSLKYIKEDGSIELLLVNGRWEFTKTAATGSKVYYSYESPDPAIGQWDAESVVPAPKGLGQTPAPCVRLWLGEQQLADAARQMMPAVSDEPKIDRLRWNLLPRYINDSGSSTNGLKVVYVISQGIIEQFSGDAILVLDFSSSFNASGFTFAADSELELAGYDLKMFEGLPSTWSILVSPEATQDLHQPASDPGTSGTLQEAVRQVLQFLRAKGAKSLAVSIQSTGAFPSLEEVASAIVNALGADFVSNEKNLRGKSHLGLLLW